MAILPYHTTKQVYNTYTHLLKEKRLALCCCFVGCHLKGIEGVEVDRVSRWPEGDIKEQRNIDMEQRVTREEQRETRGTEGDQRNREEPEEQRRVRGTEEG